MVRGALNGRAVLDRRTLHVADLQSETGEFPLGSELARKNDTRAHLVVPLMREDVAIGSISLRRTEARLFTGRQIALLQTFADQAVIAIENVRLFTELESKNRDLTTALDQQTATSEILRTIAHAQTDAQPVFDTIVRSAARLCHAATAAVFLTDGRMVYHLATQGAAPEARATVGSRYPRPLAMDNTSGIAILTRSVVHVADIEESSVLEFVRQSGRLIGFRSVVTLPMLRGGEAAGAILVARQEPGRFSDAEVELLKTFADQAVIAVENVRLFKELEDKNRALTEAHAQVTETLEQQTATSEILRVISSSPTTVEPVFATIAENAVQLCRAIYGSVCRFDGELIHLVGQYNFTPIQLRAVAANLPTVP